MVAHTLVDTLVVSAEYDDVALERRHRKDADDARVQEGLDEFLVCLLLDGRDLDAHDGTQVGRKVRIEHACEALMQHLQRPDLVFGELVRPLEVVDLDFLLFVLGLDFLGGYRTIRKRGQQLIYLRLG